MSEYQCYEFLAIDRPLTSKAMAELRSISTRAEITTTRFWNEYHWGDLKVDPAKLVARYFDAHLYFANWGTRRFILRLPAASVDERALRPYFVGGPAALTRAGRHIVVDLNIDDEEPEDDWHEGGQLAAMAPLRSQLLQGDMCTAYLAWLLAVQSGVVNDDAREPPVPGGLSKPSAPLSALAEFLRMDRDLLRAAAEGSRASSLDSASLHRWLKALPPADKDRWLIRAVKQPDQPVGAELEAAYRRANASSANGSRRTVAEIRERADELRRRRERQGANRAARAGEGRGGPAEAARGARAPKGQPLGRPGGARRG